MTKGINTHGSVVFTASVPTYTAPAISETFIDDENNKVYMLANGNTQLADSYDRIWNPTKTKVNMKGKGTTIESPQRKY